MLFHLIHIAKEPEGNTDKIRHTHESVAADIGTVPGPHDCVSAPEYVFAAGIPILCGNS